MNQLNDIYDPIVGRMLNPDNFYSRFIGNATSTQAYNRYSYVVNNPLKYTDPSGWLKYYNIDGDWRETSYTTWYGFDWEGPGRGSGGGWSTHTGWTSTTYTLFSNNSQQAGLNGYIGGETVTGDYLGSVTFLQPYSYNTFTMPDYSGAGNVVTHSGYMAAMGGGSGINSGHENSELKPGSKDEENWLKPGKITFNNFTSAKLKEYSLIPESGYEPYFPKMNGTYNVDGFYFPNPTDDKFWYKIPGTYHLVLTYDLKTDKTIGTLIHGDEGLTYGILPREGSGNKHESHKYNPFLKN